MRTRSVLKSLPAGPGFTVKRPIKDLYAFSGRCTKFRYCSARHNTSEFFLHEYVNFVHGREKPYRSLSTMRACCHSANGTKVRSVAQSAPIAPIARRVSGRVAELVLYYYSCSTDSRDRQYSPCVHPTYLPAVDKEVQESVEIRPISASALSCTVRGPKMRLCSSSRRESTSFRDRPS